MTRYREPKPSIPSILLFDETGMQNFTNAGQFHTWDTEQYCTSHFLYKLDSDKVILNKNHQNMYQITFECSFQSQNATRIIIYSQIYKNGVAVTGSRTYTSCIGNGQAITINGNVSIHYLLYLTGGDYIQVKTITDNAGATYSYTESSRLMINFIPIRGWDNDKAGRWEMKGGVLR